MNIEKNIRRSGILFQILLSTALTKSEIQWGFYHHRNPAIGIFCGVVIILFCINMYNLYIKDHRNSTLVTNGLFRYTRHPIYTGLGMIMITYWFNIPATKSEFLLTQLIFWIGATGASLIQEVQVIQRFGQKAQEYYSITPGFLFLPPKK